MTINARPLSDALGAEIEGVDLAQPLDDETFAAVHSAYLEHQVIVFRSQSLTPDQHVAFSRRFGDLEIHVMAQFLLPGHPEVLVISNDKKPDGEAAGIEDAGRYWHSDLSYLPQPSLGSILYGIEVPPEGGDTMFAGMYAAHDALAPSRRDELADKRAIHHFGSRWSKEKNKAGVRPTMSKAQTNKTPPVDHPIIRTHPETGRKALYGGGFCIGVVGMEDDGGRELVEDLTDFATQPEFIFTHTWRAGDVVFWDNRCVMHHATVFDTKHRRYMNRTTIKGDTPF